MILKHLEKRMKMIYFLTFRNTMVFFSEVIFDKYGKFVSQGFNERRHS